MVGWSGNINECSLTIDKKVQDVKISIVSLLKLPTEIGNVGFLRYATATLGRGSLTSVCFDFIENSNDLAEKIILLLDQPKKVENMGIQSSKMVQKFSWNNVVKNIIEETKKI